MKRNNDDKGSAAIGCFILLIGGFAAIGGLLYFAKCLLALFAGVRL